MSQPKYVAIDDWMSVPSWWRATIRKLFRQRIIEKLDFGVSAFSSLDELFLCIGFEHVNNSDVTVRNVRIGSMPAEAKSSSILFKLSWHSFRRLVRETPGLRLQRHSMSKVEREEGSRYEMIVGRL